MKIDSSPNIGRGIRNSRILKGLSMTELSRMAKVPKSSLSDWENGKTTPSGKSFLKIIDALQISALQIVANGNLPLLDEEKNYPYTIQKTKSLHFNDIEDDFNQLTERQKETVKNIIKAQLGIAQNEKIVPLKLFNQSACAGDGNYIDSEDYEIVEFVNPPKTAEFTIRVQGNSMEPFISDGDIIYVNPKAQLADKEIGVFSYQGETFVKQFIKKNNKTILHSFNPEFKDIEINSYDEFYINGRVL